MQSMPYYQQGYQAPQYPTSGPHPVMTNGPPMMPHPNGLPPMQHHDPTAQPSKRKQVKNACTNCQKACKKCDDARPCPRCIKYGIADTCANSVRKERKKGIKRGPYKRRQKTEGDKPTQRKTTSMPEDQTGQYANAVRAPPIPYGFPGNLNQYGQPTYEAYGHYYKEQMVAPPYGVVNPMYPQMAYPVLMQGQGDGSPSHPQHGYPHPSLPQHYGSMVQQPQQQQQPQQSQQQQPSPQPVKADQASPQLYYQQQQQQQPTVHTPQSSAPVKHSPELKSENMTPVPSASTSSGTSSSPPGSTEEEDGNKYARLSQLCTAALHQEPTGQESGQQQQQQQ